MILKALELQGFKSFADKTRFDFNTPVSAIVGPNGSGKSNVTDAIRWLLGEREARNLRGAKVEDLIFAGSEKRPRMGQAQATLIFDNSSGYFPVEYKEVSVSRKASRDGASEYFINKSPVRLKDILDFFARTRVGARGLTIINQGSSDVFIKAGPEERREMIEEVLGLKEYQMKKSDAERRLKNTYSNLDKANSLINEIKPHLKFLKKQVSRYESREAILEELTRLEDSFYGRRFKKFSSELAALRNNLSHLSKEVKVQEEVFRKTEAKLNEVKSSEPKDESGFKEIEKKRTELNEKRSAIERELARVEAKLELQVSVSKKVPDLAIVLQEIKSIAEAVMRYDDIESVRERLRFIISKINNAFGGGKESGDSELLGIQKKLSAELNELNKSIAELAKREEEVRTRLSSFSKDFTHVYELVDVERKKLETLTEKDRQTKFAIEKTELQIENLKEELRQIGRTLESLENVETEAIEMGDDETMRRMYKLRGELSGIGELDENLIKEARETEERYEFLTKQIDDLNIAIKDLKVLINELDQKIHHDFKEALHKINAELDTLMKLMFGGGRAKLVVKEQNNRRTEEQNNKVNEEGVEVVEEDKDEEKKIGIEIDLTLPKKRLKGLDVLSGGERALVSIAVLFSLISVSPPPFLVLDEVDAALDEANAKRCSNIIKEMSKKTQFILVTHNRATMEAADFLYGVTMSADGTSKLLSLKLEDAREVVAA